jgi:hypothetical protein
MYIGWFPQTECEGASHQGTHIVHRTGQRVIETERKSRSTGEQEGDQGDYHYEMHFLGKL